MIGNILKPYTFTNNVDIADATKVNTNLDVVYAGVNDSLNEINTASGTRTSLDARLAIATNPDGTLRDSAIPSALPEMSFVRRAIDTSAGDVTITLPDVDLLQHQFIYKSTADANKVIIVPAVGDSIVGGNPTLTVQTESVTLTPSSGEWLVTA